MNFDPQSLREAKMWQEFTVEKQRMTAEIEQLKSRLLDFEGRTYLQNQEITALKLKYKWLIMHSWMCSSISKAKAAEMLGVPLIDFDEEMSKIGGEI